MDCHWLGYAMSAWCLEEARVTVDPNMPGATVALTLKCACAVCLLLACGKVGSCHYQCVDVFSECFASQSSG